MLCEILGAWPTVISDGLIALLPNPAGGLRPSGIFSTLIRVWFRLRAPIGRAWEHARLRCHRIHQPRQPPSRLKIHGMASGSRRSRRRRPLSCPSTRRLHTRTRHVHKATPSCRDVGSARLVTNVPFNTTAPGAGASYRHGSHRRRRSHRLRHGSALHRPARRVVCSGTVMASARKQRDCSLSGGLADL